MYSSTSEIRIDHLTVVRILKKDIFGKIELAKLENDRLVVVRNYQLARFFARSLAAYLAYRERKILMTLESIETDFLPRLLFHEKGKQIRSYIAGTPLNESQIQDKQYYEDAKILLENIHSRGVVHNDIEKPENWLVTEENHPAIIDFQLAGYFPQKGIIFRTCAKEDRRHLLKQKARFSAENLTDEEKMILAHKSLPSRIWAKLFKPVYNFVTRTILKYSDRKNSEYSR